MVISRQIESQATDLTLPSGYLKLFLERLIQRHEDQLSLFEAAGLELACLDQATLPLDQVGALAMALDQRLPPGWHIQPCLQLEAAQHGPVGLAAISAATVGTALSTLERFERLRAPWATARMYREGQDQVLEIRQRLPLPEPASLLMEMNLLALAGLIAQLLGSQRSELWLEIPEPEAARYDALRAEFPGALKNGSNRFAIGMPTTRLAQPCLLADPELHELMIHRCQRLLRDPLERRVSARVRSALINRAGVNPGLGHTARQLGLSARSLSRHLADENTSYRRLVDETRLHIAQELLNHSQLPIADIAHRLGYSDPANFNRAYRRWTGRSPGADRRAPHSRT